MELIDLIDLTEGHDFEVKKASGRDGLGQLPGSFFETYSAMANTEGGVVLLGVDESQPTTSIWLESGILKKSSRSFGMG